MIVVTPEDVLRDALALALTTARVTGSPVHEHLGDLLDAVVPDTLAALPDGWSLSEDAALARALRTIALLLADHPEYPLSLDEAREAREVATRALGLRGRR